MTYTITIELSDTRYNQLRRAAELANRPLDTIVEQSLAHSLPPLLEDIPAEYQADIYPLLEMNARQLATEASRVFPRNKWLQYEVLLAKKKGETLSNAKEKRLAALRREADVLTLRKGYAMVLLRRRGYAVPTTDELSDPRRRAGLHRSSTHAPRTGPNISPGATMEP